MNGAVELYKACAQARRQADRRLRDLPRRRPHRDGRRRVERNHLTLLAADDAGYRNLVKLSSAGFLEGLQRGKPTVDMAQVERHSEGVIALTGCLASRFCQRLLEDRDAGGARARRRPAAGSSAPRTSTSRSRRTASPPQEKCNEGIVRIAREVGAACRDRRRPLPAPRGLRPPHGAAVRADQEHDRGAEDDLRNERVLPARQRRDDRRVRASGRRRSQHAGDRRALLGRARAGQAADPELPDARRDERARVPARARARGPAPALRRPAAGGGARADGDGARGDRPDGLQRVLPDRLGLRQVRQGERDRRRPGPRLGGRLDRRLLPGDHRRRPAALRPAVRALPQPRARVDAGHRHRLLGARSRARDALRDREVRARVGRPDRHLRQDVPARRPRATRRACSASTTAPAIAWRS